MPAYRAVIGPIICLSLVANIKAQNAQRPQGSDVLPLSPTSKWVDLTHAFDKSTINWPTEDGFQLSVEKFE